jgi:hypothetical protein
MDHVQAPQQERDAPHQIKQNKTSHTSWISRQIRVEGFTL